MCFNQWVCAQDCIVLHSGDTLQCTIQKVGKKQVHFTVMQSGVTSKGKVEKADIRELRYRVNQTVHSEDTFTGIKEAEELSIQEDTISGNSRQSELGNIRVSFNAGMGYLLGKTDVAEQSLQATGVAQQLSSDYYKQLKLGGQIKVSLLFYLWKDYWLGAMYSGFYTKAEITTPMVMDDLNMYYGKLGEHYFINFAGVSFFSGGRYGKAKKIGLNSAGSIGPAFYRNETEILNEQVLITGTALATNLNLGLEYYLQPRLGLNFEVGAFLSTLKKMKVKTPVQSQKITLDEENYENMSHLDFSVGIIYYW